MEDQRKGLLLLACVSCVLLASIVRGAAGDVPDSVVYTDLHKTVQQGNEIVLTCEFYKAPIAVYWKKGDDPDGGTDLITWVYEEEISGSCVNSKACHMTDDYSLVIGDARIADQGRYICRVSNYLGILIHNFTDVKIYAPPDEPYPIIEECTLNDISKTTQICSLPTNDTTMNITCSASRFFPDLNLFFLHDSNKITNIGSNVQENEDGTNNKSIMIKGSASEITYVCVASDIPGSKDERTATVLLRAPTVTTPRAPDTKPLSFQTTAANPVITEKTSGTSPAKIVVPMVILIIIALAGITYILWKRHQRRGTSEYTDVEETMSMVPKKKVEGIVSFYELWSLAYNTPKEEIGKVCAVIIKLGITDIKGQIRRREQVYDALCGWKQTTKTPLQAQMLTDALEEVELGARWQHIIDKRQQATARISEGTLELILHELGKPETIRNFLRKLILNAEIKGDDKVEKKDVGPDTALSHDKAKGKQKDVSYKEINLGIAEEEEDVHLEAMRKLREWNKGPFNQNPFVLVSRALERAGCSHVSKAFFGGTLSFYELRSLLFEMDTPCLDKVRDTLRELGIENEVEGGLDPQQLYEALCDWKEKHNQTDQAKILRDALERADFEEAWLTILDRRNECSGVSDGTLKQILLDIRDPSKIQRFVSRLVHCSARNLKTSAETDVIQQAMETLREWKKGPFDENPMVLLCWALEMSGCNPVDRTFLNGTMSYFELWAMVHANLEAGVEILRLRQALFGLGIRINDTTTQEQLYLLLCNWKDEHPACDHLLVLRVYLIEAGLNHAWKAIRDLRDGTHMIPSKDKLEHILWHLNDPNKINNFLQKLSKNNLESRLDNSKPFKDNVRAALAELEEWKKQPFDKHPVVILSLALESAKCSPVDKTFFKLTPLLVMPIQPEEVKSFVHKLTSRHCKRFAHEMPNIDDQRILKISDENNDTLFGTNSMISDLVANAECSNYEMRCKIDDVLINIGRHDMTDFFGTITFRRKSEDLSTKVHPMSNHFNPETIFNDDLIRLKKLMNCLNSDMVSEFCMKLGLSYDLNGETTQSPGDQELRQWRDSTLTSKSKGVFSEATELLGDTTWVDYIMDEELEYLALQVKDEKKDQLLSALNNDGDRKHGKSKKKTKRASKKEKRQMSDGLKEKQHKDEDSTSKEKQEEETSSVHDEKDEQEELTLVDQLKRWRDKQGDTSCRKTLRAALKSIGIQECIVNKTPRRFMYKAELLRVAFNILMRDVCPVIEALGIDPRKVKKYRRRVPGVDKGSLGLLLQLCEGTNKSEAYHRLDFCLVLTKLGYLDVARSTYLDYEQCESELSSIASSLKTSEFQFLMNHLDMSPEELTECHGTDGEVDRLEAMKMWRTTIRPPPFHYRLKIVNGLIAIGRRELAGDVLNGFYRRKDAEENVIKGICNRLDDRQIRNLCDLLDIKPDEDRKRSITDVLSWVNTWMEKYDPLPKAGKTPDKFQRRKQQNDELAQAGFYELANEIMILEYSSF